MVLGAATKDRLFGAVTGGPTPRPVEGVTITTDDGSMGVKGWVSTVLPEVIRQSRAKIIFGCGPMAMLRSITDTAGAQGAVAHVAVEESMACGIGVCMTCVMPVVGAEGLTKMARTCVEGPVFRGDQIRWEAFDNGQGRCLVPEDAYGASAMKGH
jgi:dihydroorotate dehydrogenase electron transfer subunit